jgi:hypothetical protein
VAPANLPPCAHAVVDAGDGGERVQAQRQVKLAPAQVVHDAHLVAASRQVQRSGPAAVAVTTCRQAQHSSSQVSAVQLHRVVVRDAHLTAESRQVQRRGPAAVAVTTCRSNVQVLMRD